MEETTEAYLPATRSAVERGGYASMCHAPAVYACPNKTSIITIDVARQCVSDRGLATGTRSVQLTL